MDMADSTTPSTPQPPPTPRYPECVGGISVFSGGTAANFLVDVFDRIIEKQKCPLRYIIPISDNGGSSSELIRVFGGPSECATVSYLVYSDFVEFLMADGKVAGVGDVRSELNSSLDPPLVEQLADLTPSLSL